MQAKVARLMAENFAGQALSHYLKDSGYNPMSTPPLPTSGKQAAPLL